MENLGRRWNFGEDAGILEILLTEQGEVLEKIQVVRDFGIFVQSKKKEIFGEGG